MSYHRPRSAPKTIKTVTLALDFSLALEQMVAAADFSHVDEGFARCCRPSRDNNGHAVHEVAWFHFDYYISTKEALHEICVYDVGHVWQPAKVEHLIAFGAKQPHEQLKYPINALGSPASFRGRPSVPCLHHVNSKRALILDIPRWDRGWEPDYRFLAYRSSRKGLLSWMRRP